MKPANPNLSNYAKQTSLTSQRAALGFRLTVAATLLFGLTPSIYSIAQTQNGASQAGAEHAGWVQVPGELIRPDCVHEIPSGARVEMENGKITGDVTLQGSLMAHYDACSEDAIVTRPQGQSQKVTHTPGTGNGWVEADQWEASLSGKDNIDFMGGTWTVPSYPSENGALIYLFNGIEPATENWILQPVLQYGANGAFGGNYYVIASWMIGPNGYAFYSSPEVVYPGNTILGYTEITGTSGSTLYWETKAYDQSTGRGSWITAHTSGLHWTWAFAAVLEAYNVTSCAEFPATGHEQFLNSTVDHGFPSYSPLYPNFVGAIYPYGGPQCHFAAMGSSGNLDF